MYKTLSAFVFFLFLLLGIPSLSFAGGGLIEPIKVETPNGAHFAKLGEAYTLTFRVHLNNADSYDPTIKWCKQCPTKVVFVDPQSGDIVNAMSDKTDDNGEITAKVTSGVPLVRYAYAVATLPDGTEYEGSRVFMNFTGNLLYYPTSQEPQYNLPVQSSPTPVPTETPLSVVNGKIEAWLLNQNLLDRDNRNVTIKWSAFDGNPTKSKIYGSTDKNSWNLLLSEQRGPSATFNIPANVDYYIKLNGCVHKYGNCVDSNILFLPRLAVQSPVVIPSPSPSSPSALEKEDISQKIASLEAQLEQSQKEQNMLAQRVEDLVNFIRGIFPFFK